MYVYPRRIGTSSSALVAQASADRFPIAQALPVPSRNSEFRISPGRAAHQSPKSLQSTIDPPKTRWSSLEKCQLDYRLLISSLSRVRSLSCSCMFVLPAVRPFACASRHQFVFCCFILRTSICSFALLLSISVSLCVSGVRLDRTICPLLAQFLFCWESCVEAILPL